MYHYFLSAQLYILSILFSFYLSSILIKNKYINQDTSENDKLEQEMITHCTNYMFQFKYLDDLNEVDICFNNVVNKENITELEIPFLNNKIIMFYDTEKEAFCYYTKGDLIYKYLNVACRKYVIEHNCRHLYLDMESAKETVNENKIVSRIVNNVFINNFKKSNKPLLTKNVNKFILVGSLDDYEESLNDNVIVKNISFKDYCSLNHASL